MVRNRLRASGLVAPGLRWMRAARWRGTGRDRRRSMDTPRTDRYRAEALARLIYTHDAVLHSTRVSGTRVAVYAYLGEHRWSCGWGVDEADAWRVALKHLRARAVALGDALAAELGAP